MAVEIITAREQVAELYTAAFNRVPDATGLAYWTDLYANKGVTLAQIAQGFTSSLEYSAKYPTFLTNDEYVTKIYTNVFNRAADADGKAFWVGKLTDGSLTWGTIMQSMLDAAHANGSADGARLTNIGNFGVWAAAGGYDVTSVSTYIASITSNAATVTAAETAVAAGNSSSGTTGQTFTLTTGTDTLSPTSAVAGSMTTSGNDTIRVATAASLNTADSVDAGAGIDTMNVSAGGFVTAQQPLLTSVEIINISNNAALALNLFDATGITNINVGQGTAGTHLTLNNASLDTTFSTLADIDGTATASSIDIDIKASTAGLSDTIKLAAADNNGSAITFQSTTDTATIEYATLAANGSTSGANSVADQIILHTTDLAIKGLTVTGTGNLTVTAASANLTSVDASTTSGNNTYTFAGAAGKTVTAGSGNDTIVTGAGADTLIGGAGADTMTGALGIDTFSIKTNTIEDLGFDTITAADFVAATDFLKFVGGAAGSATNYAETTGTGDGFVSARSSASTLLAGNSNLVYVAVADATAGNVYVFYDGNGDHLLSTNGSDFAVKLTTNALTDVAFTSIIAG